MRHAIEAFIILAFVALPAGAQQQALRDHPLLTPYPGSQLEDFLTKEFDEFTLPLAKPGADRLPGKSTHLEGRVTRYSYHAPEKHTLLEVWTNYTQAMRSAGFETLYECANDTCGNSNVRLFAAGEDEWTWACGQRDISAKLARPEGDAYVNLFVAQSCTASRPPYVRLYVIEPRAMDTGLIKVDATALANDITRTGHAAVYGIFFDTGKADVKPESDPAMKEIAKLLQQNPKLRLYVVGHTDNQGGLEANMALSSRRANAVMDALKSRYGVASARMKAFGAGPYAPVASNSAEAGRAKNRRVELVEQ